MLERNLSLCVIYMCDLDMARQTACKTTKMAGKSIGNIRIVRRGIAWRTSAEAASDCCALQTCPCWRCEIDSAAASKDRKQVLRMRSASHQDMQWNTYLLHSVFEDERLRADGCDQGYL